MPASVRQWAIAFRRRNIVIARAFHSPALGTNMPKRETKKWQLQVYGHVVTAGAFGLSKIRRPNEVVDTEPSRQACLVPNEELLVVWLPYAPRIKRCMDK
jgi:hypothetical protein